MNPNFSGVTANGEYGRMGQPVVPQTPVNVPSTFSATDLTSGTQRLAIPQFTPPQVPNIATVESLFQGVEAPTQAETTQSDLSRRLAEATKALGGKEAATIEAENAAGLPQFQTQLNDIQGQIKQLNAQALANQEKALASGETLSFASGEAQRVARNDAIKGMSLNAIAQTLQGNIALAKDFAERAVKLQFEPKQAELDYLKTALELNRDTLTREDKKRTQKLEIELNERQRLLDQQKDDKKTILGFGAEASSNGASSLLINRAMQETDPARALAILAPYMSNPLEKQSALLDMKYKEAQINKLNAEAREAGVGVDGSQILAYAQQYASTGTIPTGLPKGTFGLVSKAAKELPKQEGTVIDVNTGTKPNISDVKIDGLAALYDISKKAQELKTRFKDIVPGVAGGITGTVLGSDDLRAYTQLKQEIVDLMSRARSGAALTEEEVKNYESRLPTRFSNSFFLGTNGETQIDTFQKLIEDTLNTKLRANGTAIVGFSTIDVNGQQYKVGQTVTNSKGEVGRINADGTVTVIK